MRRLAGLVGAIVLAWAGMPALAEGPALPGFLQRIEGVWRGAGEVRGMAADMRMRWEPALDGKFHRLAMQNRMTGQDGAEWRFEAEGFYRALEDGSVTLKRLKRDNGNVFLIPENPAFQPIEAPSAKILGRVIGVMRKY
jgi:hypothetical protein